MSVTVYGAGAIGGTVGAFLTRAGIPVLFVDRDLDHVAAMNERGLMIQNRDRTFTVAVKAVTPSRLDGPLDLVLLAVKAQHTADAMDVIAPLLHGESTVVSLPGLYCPRERRDWVAIDRSLDTLDARRRRDVKTQSGIWRDLAVRNRPTEVDQQIGLAAEIGATDGLPMPLTRRLVEMIHELEAGTRERTVSNVDELEALRREIGADSGTT